jgi:hypothetical protein
MFGDLDTPKQKALVTTLTGEPYQPARLYYEVSNQKTVIGAFKKLRCMQWEPRLEGWRWLYDGEAKKLRFERSWNKIPKENRPIVIGDFFFRSATELILDVRSFKRLTTAIVFFDKHINRRVAQVTKVRVVNKFFDANNASDMEHIHPPFDYFFDRSDIKRPSPEALLEQMERAISDTEDPDSRIQTFDNFFKEQAKPQAEIEEIPIHFYDDGIESLEFALLLRSGEAMEHWRGNKTFSQMDLMRQLMQKVMETAEFFDDEGDELLEEEDETPADNLLEDGDETPDQEIKDQEIKD